MSKFYLYDEDRKTWLFFAGRIVPRGDRWFWKSKAKLITDIEKHFIRTMPSNMNSEKLPNLSIVEFAPKRKTPIDMEKVFKSVLIKNIERERNISSMIIRDAVNGIVDKFDYYQLILPGPMYPESSVNFQNIEKYLSEQNLRKDIKAKVTSTIFAPDSVILRFRNENDMMMFKLSLPSELTNIEKIDAGRLIQKVETILGNYDKTLNDLKGF